MHDDMPVTRGQAVKVADLVLTREAVQGESFEDCLFVGPAVVVLSGEVGLVECTFEGNPDHMLWEIPAGRERVIGAVPFRDTSFTRCRFQRVGFAGTADFLRAFKEGTQPSDEVPQ